LPVNCESNEKIVAEPIAIPANPNKIAKIRKFF